MGVLHAERRGALVHPRDEGVLRAGDVLREGDAAVVRGDDGDAFEHLVNAHLLTLLQPDLAAAHPGSVGGRRYLIVQCERAGLDCLYHEQHGHHLRDRGGGEPLIGVFLVEHGAGRFFYQDRRGRGNGDRVVINGLHRRGGSGEQSEGEEKGKELFHGCALPPKITLSKAYVRLRRIMRGYITRRGCGNYLNIHTGNA